jgi:hypothetical protein
MNKPQPNTDGMCLLGGALAVVLCYLVVCVVGALLFGAIKL